jgi:chromosome segregation ATPase
MARQGVTYEQVEAVATALAGAGQAVTLRAVRDGLGSGSMTTIAGHLAAWREARPSVASVPYELPADLANAFGRELRRGADEAVARVQAELVQARGECKELASAGEALEVERDELLAQVAERTSERDQAAATAAERAGEISRLAEALAREQQAVEAARVQLATALLRGESQAERVAELRGEIEVLRQQLAEAQRGRVVAEQAAAVLQAQAASEARRADQAEARERTATDAAGQAQAALATVQAQASSALAEAERRAGSEAARAAALADQVKDLRAERERLAAQPPRSGSVAS